MVEFPELVDGCDRVKSNAVIIFRTSTSNRMQFFCKSFSMTLPVFSILITTLWNRRLLSIFALIYCCASVKRVRVITLGTSECSKSALTPFPQFTADPDIDRVTAQ